MNIQIELQDVKNLKLIAALNELKSCGVDCEIEITSANVIPPQPNIGIRNAYIDDIEFKITDIIFYDQCGDDFEIPEARHGDIKKLLHDHIYNVQGDYIADSVETQRGL